MIDGDLVLSVTVFLSFNNAASLAADVGAKEICSATHWFLLSLVCN